MGRKKLAKGNTETVTNQPPKILKLDFGCGTSKKDGFEGVDSIKFDGVDHVVDLTVTPWPWTDNSVDEGHASHFVEHLTARDRIKFANELYRVLKPGAKCVIVTPHWASCRAYGDMTHQWPPVSEFWFYYLNKKWRAGDPTATPPLPANAPHDDSAFNPDGYSCNFEATWGYTIRGDLASRNLEYQQKALSEQKEAAQDMVATLVKI